MIENDIGIRYIWHYRRPIFKKKKTRNPITIEIHSLSSLFYAESPLNQNHDKRKRKQVKEFGFHSDSQRGVSHKACESLSPSSS